MSTNKIILEKVKSIDAERLNMLATRIAKENNKSVAYVKQDMVKNFLKYKIGYTDYFKGNYINLTEKEKKGFVTSKNFINLLNYLNPKEYRVLTYDKLVFNQIFKKYLKREYIDIRTATEEQIKNFLKNKENIFAKPTTDFGGHNISKIKTKDIKDVKKLKEELLKKEQYLLEEEIIQAKIMSDMSPFAVNSLRIVTLYKDGKIYVLANALRINLDDEEVLVCRDGDARVNEDGTLASKIYDDDGNCHDKHPITGYDFSKVKKIPYVKDAIEMVKEAALLIPNIRYIGWDVAITENGPLIIEGNEIPSYGLVQNYKLNPENPGHLKQIREILKDEMNNINLEA